MAGSKRVRTIDRLPISPSTLKQFDRCKRMYYFAKLAQLPDGDSDAALKGREVHRRIAARLAGEEPPVPDVKLGSEEDFAKLAREADKVAAILREDEDIIAIEEPIDHQWTLPSGTVVEARVIPDALAVTTDGRARGYDYKSGWLVPTDLSDDLQGLFTAIMVYEEYGCWEFTWEHFQLRKSEDWQPKPVTYTIEDILAFREVMLRKAQVMDAEQEYPPDGAGTACYTCRFATQCDAGQRYLTPVITTGLPTLPAIRDSLQAAAFAKGLSMVDALRAQAIDALSEWTLWDGPAFVDDDQTAAWGHWEHKTREVSDVRRFIEICTAHGVDPIPLLKVDLKAAEKYIWGSKRPHRDPIPGLARLVKSTITTRFSLKKNLARS